MMKVIPETRRVD